VRTPAPNLTRRPDLSPALCKFEYYAQLLDLLTSAGTLIEIKAWVLAGVQVLQMLFLRK
jgi:hypothetical protein